MLLIVNNITSETITGNFAEHYSYSSKGGTARHWSGTNSNVFGGSVLVGTESAPNISLPASANAIFKNRADADLSMTLDSGNSAAQGISVFFKDRGTTKWSFEKDSSNVFQLLKSPSACCSKSTT